MIGTNDTRCILCGHTTLRCVHCIRNSLILPPPPKPAEIGIARHNVVMWMSIALLVGGMVGALISALLRG